MKTEREVQMPSQMRELPLEKERVFQTPESRELHDLFQA